jgi:NAD(P)H-flavin reductase
VPTLTIPLLHVEPVTPRTRLVTLDLNGHVFDFRPGQAVMIGAAGTQPHRPYSIACSPERAFETQKLEMLIALEADGTLGPHLPDTTPGTLIEVEGPLGTFFFPVDLPKERLLFVAGGTGIAPLRAMIDHVLRHKSGLPAVALAEAGISLLYSARNSQEFAFNEELRGHEERGRLELHCTVTRDDTSWAGGRGRIGRSHFERVLHDPANTMCFVCGPRTLVNESVTTLSALGVRADAIRTEEWVVPRG